MRRSLLILNLALLAAAGLLGYRLRVEWRNHRARTQWVYRSPAVEAAGGATAAATAPAAENWAEIVARNVFSADRSSVSASAATPPPEPILFGTMNLGSGPIALMSEVPSRGYRQVHLGDAIGGFKLVAVEGQKVTLEWAGGQIKLDAAESASRVRAQGSVPEGMATPASAAVRTPTQTSTRSAGGATVVSPSPSSSAGAGSPLLERFPELRGMASRQQIEELEREPPGTIRNGKVKRFVITPFGPSIWWEDIKAGAQK